MRRSRQRPNGALPLRPWDLAQLGQNGCFVGRIRPPRPFRLLSRRSGRIPALPYPPLRYYQSGLHRLRRTMLLQPTALTPLTSCLSPRVHFSSVSPSQVIVVRRRHPCAKYSLAGGPQMERPCSVPPGTAETEVLPAKAVGKVFHNRRCFYFRPNIAVPTVTPLIAIPTE